MAAPVRIIGSYLSPYVRKVLVCLRTKGVPYEIDPIIPFVGDDRFSQLSPAPADPRLHGRPRDARRLVGDLPVPGRSLP